MASNQNAVVENNMKLWTAVRTVDKKFTKPITGKSYKGDSPNPTYIIMKLTEQLGPVGREWGFDVDFDRVRQGRPHQVTIEQSMTLTPPDQEGNQKTLSKTVRYEIVREEYHEVCITFWQMVDGQKRTFSAYGGTPMLYLTKSGSWMHDEDAAKKSLTDAYTKAASWLGACADIFLGLFDDKYTSQPHQGAEPPQNGQQGTSEGQGTGERHEGSQGGAERQQQQEPPQSGERKETVPDW